MALEFYKYPLGWIETNCYLLVDTVSQHCVLIDPAADAPYLQRNIQLNHWQLQAIWLTHAHFDHIGAVAALCRWQPALPIYLHRADWTLYQAGGGAKQWGVPFEQPPNPTAELTAGQVLQLGPWAFRVLHVPGHSPGHVAFYQAEYELLFGGDVLFRRGVGRTDLPGGNAVLLLQSIQQQFFALPAATTVLPGHGEVTTIGEEQLANPFV